MSRTHLNSFTTTLSLMGLILTSAAHAQTVDHSGIITTADVATLSADLGQGPLALTRIFSYVTGDGKTVTDFHTAADGQGPTFTLFKLTDYQTPGGSVLPLSAIVGGYDPASWASTGGSTRTYPLSDRTGFLFNLTQPILLRQRTDTFGRGVNDNGSYQTFNYAGYGPAFGGGFDLGGGPRLDSSYEFPYSYGSLLGLSYATVSTVSDMEVFTFTAEATSTPEPGSVALLVASGLIGVGAVRRKRAHKISLR
jgi:hypothetical protein